VRADDQAAETAFAKLSMTMGHPTWVAHFAIGQKLPIAVETTRYSQTQPFVATLVVR
jgi:hypothetical protein